MYDTYGMAGHVVCTNVAQTCVRACTRGLDYFDSIAAVVVHDICVMCHALIDGGLARIAPYPQT